MAYLLHAGLTIRSEGDSPSFASISAQRGRVAHTPITVAHQHDYNSSSPTKLPATRIGILVVPPLLTANTLGASLRSACHILDLQHAGKSPSTSTASAVPNREPNASFVGKYDTRLTYPRVATSMCRLPRFTATMKALSFAILALLCLLLNVGAQTHATSTSAVKTERGLLSQTDSSLTVPTTATDLTQASDSAPLIEGTLGLPVMRDQLTITESAQDLSLNLEDLDSSYGKMMQDFAATLEGEGDATGASIGKRSSKRHQLLDILVGFIIEVVITLIVLKVAFLMGEFRYRLSKMVPISLAVAFVGALLNVTLNISLLNPIQIGLSSLIMLMLIRLMTEAHEWADALKTTLVARLVTIALTWLAVTGMTVIGL